MVTDCGPRYYMPGGHMLTLNALEHYAGNLPEGIPEREVEEEFARFRSLRKVWVARRPAGFGE